MITLIGIVGLLLIAVVVVDIAMTNMSVSSMRKLSEVELSGQKLTLENMQRTLDRERRLWEEHRDRIENEVRQIRMGAPITYKMPIREALDESQRAVARVSWPSVFDRVQEDVDE